METKSGDTENDSLLHHDNGDDSTSTELDDVASTTPTSPDAPDASHSRSSQTDDEVIYLVKYRIMLQ